MRKFLCLILLSAFVSACPDPQTGKIDPYMTARTVVIQANVALSLADGIFNQWLLSQTDQEKAKTVRASYQKIKTAVANGLQLALNGIDIAEQAKKDPNITALMSLANDAWSNLRKFLEDLMSKPDAAKAVDMVASAPPAAKQPSTGGVGSTKSALTQKVSPS